MFSFKNNILSTINIANRSINSFVNKFVLVSSDKAVRPKSMMESQNICQKFIFKKLVKILN